MNVDLGFRIYETHGCNWTGLLFLAIIPSLNEKTCLVFTMSHAREEVLSA